MSVPAQNSTSRHRHPHQASAPASLATWFSRSLERYPQHPALEVAGHTLSYRQLAGAVDVVRRAMPRSSGTSRSAVALLSSRAPLTYAGYLACAYEGVPVVPLSPDHPVERNLEICRAAEARLILTDEATAGDLDPRLATDASTRIVVVDQDELLREAGLRPSEDLARRARRDAHRAHDEVAYVLFTSGSTGRPKGVPIRHRQLAEYVPYCAARYGVGPDSRLSQTFDLTFDPSVFDLAVAWYSGASVVVPQPADLAAPASFVADNRLTHWFSVPSIVSIAHRMHGLRPGAMPTLRWSLFAGEQLTVDQARLWGQAAPNSTIENLYGPTELTITCTAYRLPKRAKEWPRASNGTVPIGQVYRHLEAALRREDGQFGEPAAIGEGELCVRGSQRFDGYLDPRDDAEQFLAPSGSLNVGTLRPGPDDWYRTGDLVRWEDGSLIHLGRIDQQIKLNGRRVELGEIEAVLRSHTNIEEAVVVTTDGQAGRRVHAFYTGDETPPAELLDHCRRRVPNYMVPSGLTWVSEFPLNGNRKIDRRALIALL